MRKVSSSKNSKNFLEEHLLLKNVAKLYYLYRIFRDQLVSVTMDFRDKKIADYRVTIVEAELTNSITKLH